MNFSKILELQKNRFPMLFLDSILHLEEGKSVKVCKNFTYNEWYFPIHFEDEPVVPGFVIMETMRQTFLLTFLSLEKYQGMQTADSKIKLFQIRRKLIPGDTLVLVAKLNNFYRGVATGVVKGYLLDEEVCSLDVEVVIPEILNEYQVALL